MSSLSKLYSLVTLLLAIMLTIIAPRSLRLVSESSILTSYDGSSVMIMVFLIISGLLTTASQTLAFDKSLAVLAYLRR